MGQSNWVVTAQNKNQIGLLKPPKLITDRSELWEASFFLILFIFATLSKE
jgi:hypothetical protein